MSTRSCSEAVNTHVHFPPNFSAFDTVAEAVAAAAAQGVRAVGISNFYDQSVYGRFAEAAVAAGIAPLYGLEFITLDPALEAAGVRVNDPANPGRMYLCGKGIDPFREKSGRAGLIADEIRAGNDLRASRMVSKLAAHFAAAGLETGLTSAAIAQAVAERGQVPLEWVSLQERHIARAFQEAVWTLLAGERGALLERVFGGPAAAALDDAAAVQGELRTRLMKAGKAGFVDEAPLSFADAYEYVLLMGGIPTYPTLADGASPVCEFEADPAQLAQALVERGIHAAELIPVRNRSRVVDDCVAAFTQAGLIVMAGTEHNTPKRIPLEPACADGPLSDVARQAFWEGTCVVAAHQALVADGEAGFVDETGALTGERAELAELGARIIKGE
ncbi:MAG: hypothetical protein LBR32_09220 [Propionibacteriaceae bacterium]|jgi:hypothetical protein|nr:hypothetical protein [Propionibacteriaceae bacterium]